MYKTNSLPKLSLFVVITVLASFSLVAPSFVHAIEILFEDNFKGGKLDGSGKWHVSLGKWTIQGGELRNTSGDKSLIIVTDKHWDPEWVEYWLYAKIRISAGTEPAIFWRFHSDGSQGGNFSPAGSLPKQMQESGRRHEMGHSRRPPNRQPSRRPDQSSTRNQQHPTPTLQSPTPQQSLPSTSNHPSHQRVEIHGPLFRVSDTVCSS